MRDAVHLGHPGDRGRSGARRSPDAATASPSVSWTGQASSNSPRRHANRDPRRGSPTRHEPARARRRSAPNVTCHGGASPRRRAEHREQARILHRHGSRSTTPVTVPESDLKMPVADWDQGDPPTRSSEEPNKCSRRGRRAPRLSVCAAPPERPIRPSPQAPAFQRRSLSCRR